MLNDIWKYDKDILTPTKKEKGTIKEINAITTTFITDVVQKVIYAERKTLFHF